MFFQVPQKRERLFLVAIRNDLANKVLYQWPAQYSRIMTMRDAMFAGELYANDVPISSGQTYPEERKKAVLDPVPQGGYWRDFPDEIQR
jgi:DNA (cytosine-5)-methyltransferase 1